MLLLLQNIRGSTKETVWNISVAFEFRISKPFSLAFIKLFIDVISWTVYTFSENETSHSQK